MLESHLVTTCSIAGWAVQPDDGELTAGRLAIDTTLILVSVTFKNVLSALLPPIAYLTLLDSYTMLCIAFLSLCVLLQLHKAILTAPASATEKAASATEK